MHAMPGLTHVPQLALQHDVPAPHVVRPQGSPRSATQAQTDGEESKWEPRTQSSVSMHSHTPPQSAPPFVGSQLSLGSSTQRPAPGQGMPAIPPQKTELPASSPPGTPPLQPAARDKDKRTNAETCFIEPSLTNARPLHRGSARAL